MKILAKVARCTAYLFLAVLAFIMLFPIVLAILNSLKSNMEIMADASAVLPKNPTLHNYYDVWNSDAFSFGTMFFNSIWYTVASVFITVLSSCMMGYVYSRGKFRGKKIIFAVFLGLMFINMGGITIYPTFKVLNKIHISQSLAALLFTQLFTAYTGNAIIVKGFVDGIPIALDEAARIDGCSFIGIFFRVIMPMLKPCIITIGLLSFNASWNSYLMPAMFTMTRPEQQTLIVGLMALKNSGQAAANWNLIYAASVVVMAPVIIAFLFGNKSITKGMTIGAVKG